MKNSTIEETVDYFGKRLGTMVILGDLDNCYRTMRIWFLLYR